MRSPSISLRDINSPYLSSQNPFWLACILSGQTAVTKCFHRLVMYICKHSALATVFQGRSLYLALHHTTHIKWPHYRPSCLLYFKGQKECSLNYCCFSRSCEVSGEATDHLTCNQDFIPHNYYVEIHLIKQMKQAHTHILSCAHYHKYKYIFVLIKICGDITLISIHPKNIWP